MYFRAIAYTFFIISSLFGCRNCTFLLSFSQTKALPISHPTLPPVQWHSAMQSERYQIEMLVGYHWLTCCCCFDEQCILCCESEMVRVIASRWQVSRICIVFGYAFQHIPFKWMHHTFRDIVWHLIIDSALFTLQSYIQFFCKRLLFQFECQAYQPIIGSAS
jgi:hypothetical protein